MHGQERHAWLINGSITASSNGTSSFANCWYRKKTPYSPSVCDVINIGAGCQKPDYQDFANVKDFWVTWSIYNTFDFFVNLNSGITGAEEEVSDAVGKVVTALDPPNPSGSTPGWEYVLDALTFGFSLYSEGTVALKAALRAIPQSSTLIGKVYPQGDVSGTVTEWANVAGEVGQFCQTWANLISSALEDVVTDPEVFTAWSSAGQLTGGEIDMTQLTDSLTTTVTTYMIATASNAAGYLMKRTADVDVNQLQENSSLRWSTGCGGGYDSSGSWCLME
ncbi:hypothetical protein PRZ48_005519 [Zasmidium cellare]|uniref:Uncharacterized protein n=1 Tax=Zasmidium cellare TaxID=395010 RepID=A0ABR0ETW2_ZASCE|nr:hypothetical protein PRZ48_005519 [Zasmidium cellare]